MDGVVITFPGSVDRLYQIPQEEFITERNALDRQREAVRKAVSWSESFLAQQVRLERVRKWKAQKDEALEEG